MCYVNFGTNEKKGTYVELLCISLKGDVLKRRSC